MGVKCLELWAGSSCEPKAGNAPQEPSSHSEPPPRSLFTALPSRSRRWEDLGRGEKVGPEEGGGGACHSLPHTLSLSPIPAGALS